ncbi:MAG: RNA 2',3'-cyclic phosphodiesterase [Burkholderiales bacterium]
MPQSGKQGLENLKTARVFFALWPDAAVREGFAQWSQQLHKSCGGRITRPGNIHLTLVFLGAVPAARLNELKSLAAGISAPVFHLDFNAPGYFQHKRIVWVGPVEIPPALSSLVERMETGLKQAGFRFDQRPYVPHATLLRNVRREPDASLLQVIKWTVEDFVLVRSQSGAAGVDYKVIGRWPEPSSAV